MMRGASDEPEPPAVMTKNEAFSVVWELTREVYALSGRFDAESRLQRHVVRVERKRR